MQERKPILTGVLVDIGSIDHLNTPGIYCFVGGYIRTTTCYQNLKSLTNGDVPMNTWPIITAPKSNIDTKNDGS